MTEEKSLKHAWWEWQLICDRYTKLKKIEIMRK